MKIKLSKSQWEMIGRKTGWMNKKAKSDSCPKCKSNETTWTHGKCPKCHHANAIINGVCRDCKEKSKDVIDNYCKECKHEWSRDVEM